ncbi:MAG TPA: DNA repair protein RecO [Coriobacteriia bacterium]
MPAYPLRALVLRKTKLGETDLILTLLAADGRQVRAVAKGARKSKSRLGARVEPFSVLDLLLHTGRNLEIIAEAETVETHDALRADYDRTLAASVVVDVLDKGSMEGQAEPQFFDMAVVTLDVMESAPVEALEALVLAFLLKSLAMHGYRPALDRCAACGAEPTGPLAFSVESGGVLCGRCSGDGSGARPITGESREALRAMLRSKMADVPSIVMAPGVASDVRWTVRSYTGFHIPARLRALDYYLTQGR